MKEALVAIGLVFVLGGACAAIWSASVVAVMDRADEERSTYIDPWYSDPWEEDSPFDQMRTLYSVVLAGALAVLVIGTGLIVYGLREAEPETVAPMTNPDSVPGSKSFCQYCGGFVDAASVRCPSCGRLLAEA